jgi:hypothetical protein
VSAPTLHDQFTLGPDRRVMLMYPEHITAEEAELLSAWLALCGEKLRKSAPTWDLVRSLAGRCAAQSDLLGKAAEKAAEVRADLANLATVATHPVVERCDGIDGLLAPDDDPPAAEDPGAASHCSGEAAVAEAAVAEAVADVLCAIADGAKEEPSKEEQLAFRSLEMIDKHGGLAIWRLANLLRIGREEAGEVLQQYAEWFVIPGDRRSPVQLTKAGRHALAESRGAAAEIIPPQAETIPASAETITTTAETIPAADQRPELSAKDRARAQCQLIAEALLAAGKPLDAYEVAKETGLPYDVVAKRLKNAGPSAPGTLPRYFAVSSKDSSLWLLTNSGHELAKGDEAL